LPQGDIPYDLVNRLASEASKAAEHVLNICIRALDYCPPVDITFGEYLRALITADRDLVPDDKLGYRVAFLQGFRRRGIYPQLVSNLSPDNVCWRSPDVELPNEQLVGILKFSWDLRINRRHAYDQSQENAETFRRWLRQNISAEQAEALGFFRSSKSRMEVNGRMGERRGIEVHSVRPVRRVGPDNQQHLDLVVEITQSWVPADGGPLHRGGTTLIIDLERGRIMYSISKRVANPEHVKKQLSFRMEMDDATLRSNYFDDRFGGREPFAMLHSGE
jgi:hypothetical protein